MVGVINIILSHGMLSKSWAGAGDDVASPVNSTAVLSSRQAFRQPAVVSPVQQVAEESKQRIFKLEEKETNELAIVVTGAGSSEVNGCYLFKGSRNGNAWQFELANGERTFEMFKVKEGSGWWNIQERVGDSHPNPVHYGVEGDDSDDALPPTAGWGSIKYKESWLGMAPMPKITSVTNRKTCLSLRKNLHQEKEEVPRGNHTNERISSSEKLNFVEMAMNVDEAGNKSQLVIYRTYRDASWRSKPVYMNAIEVTQQNVPGATQIVFTDADIEKWMEEHFPAGTPEHGAFHSIHPQWGVARSDLWRLLVIWVHGGLYLDMKSVARGTPPPLEGKMITTRWRVRTSCNDVQVDEVINWYVYAPKGSPVLRHLIDALINNLKAEQSNTRSNEYHKLVDADSCASEAKARVLYTTGPRAVSLALEKMPAHLQQWVTESNTNGQNPTLRKRYNIHEFRLDFPALDGAVEYGDPQFESGAHSHILVEGSNHYSTFVGVPLTSHTSHSATKQYVSTDQQWDVVIFAPTPPGAYSGDTHRLRQFIRFFAEQGLKMVVVVHTRERAVLSREDWTRMIYSPSK